MSFLRRLEWKHALLFGLVALLLVRIGGDLSGRGRRFWHLDFNTLWWEQSRFYDRRYPHDEVTRARAGERPVRSDYPPSSFPLFIPWIPPGVARGAAEVWFTGCQAIAALVLMGFAWRRGREREVALAAVLACGVLTMTGLRADLLFGNLAAITVALLIGMACAMERERWWLAALFWAAAMVKPQIGWLFALLFLRREGWRALAFAVVGLALSAFAACAWTRVTLLDIVNSGYDSSLSAITNLAERNSLVNLVVQAGAPWTGTLVSCAFAGVVVAAWALLGPLKDAGVLPRLALVGVVNRICTYHNACDDLLLVFALTWLGRTAWQSGRRIDWAAFLALGATVWMPALLLQFLAMKIAVVGVWMALVVWIARQRKAA